MTGRVTVSHGGRIAAGDAAARCPVGDGLATYQPVGGWWLGAVPRPTTATPQSQPVTPATCSGVCPVNRCNRSNAMFT